MYETPDQPDGAALVGGGGGGDGGGEALAVHVRGTVVHGGGGPADGLHTVKHTLVALDVSGAEFSYATPGTFLNPV